MFKEGLDGGCDVALNVNVVHLTNCSAQETHCLITHPDVLGKGGREGGREGRKKGERGNGEELHVHACNILSCSSLGGQGRER